MSDSLILDRDLSLAPIRLNDAACLFAETDRSRDHLRQWLPWLDGVRTVEDTRRFIQVSLSRRSNNTGAVWVIRVGDAVAGVIDFHHIDGINRTAAIGYWLGQRFVGQGIMTRSATAIRDYGFRTFRFNRIEIRVAPGNTRSEAIALRLGFQLEGVLKEAEWIYDHFVDHRLYAMILREWKAILGR